MTSPDAGAATPGPDASAARVPSDGAAGSPVALRFRDAPAGLFTLPWALPLATWPEAGIAFLPLPVGESRHVVRFLAVDDVVFALKELPLRPARGEYAAMRYLEEHGAPAVRIAGLVERPADETAIVVTRYLARSLQLRRLFRRLPEAGRRHRERLLDAMAMLLVELHRNGVYWGDCSLANTLLLRDGQSLQAHLVDAETSEVHATLSAGQRAVDVEIALENVAGDLLDIAVSGGRALDDADDDLAAALSLRDRYETLWAELHRSDPVGPQDRFRVAARLRRLNALGFVVEEVRLDPAAAGNGGATARLRVAVGDRRFHADRLHRLTGLTAGEGQATVLLNDLAAWAGLAPPEGAGPLADEPLEVDVLGPMHRAGRRWLRDIFVPMVTRLRAVLGEDADPVQAYCDFLEVKWLLSEEAGRDIGDAAAIARLAAHSVPAGSAAGMAVAEEPTLLGPAGEVLLPPA